MPLQLPIQKYLEWKSISTQRAPRTYEFYLHRFNEYAHKTLEEVTIDDVVKFQTLLKRKYSPGTVAYSAMILKNFFRYWRDRDVKCVAPGLIKIPRFIPNSHVPVTFDDYVKLEKAFGDGEFFQLQKKIVIRLLWETGMRVSEICSLNVMDIDSVEPHALIKTSKAYRKEWVRWSQETHRMVIKHLGTRICLNQRPALFISHRGYGWRDRICPKTVQRWVKEACESANIKKKISPHSFRHGKAHHMLWLGANAKHIQAVLRHSENNPASSFQYLRLSELEFDRIASKYL
ncbi:MAG: tyrosine-type recombinase/integrase [Patescibacteria group bacterium]|nr:tyrosine-type recombinase/integrase [Patescibacteria group bacterium]